MPRVYFHISYPFHHWFLYYRGDFTGVLETLKGKVARFEALWAEHEERILALIPRYLGRGWPHGEIHVYCFENADYYDVPCISDPVCVNMTGENVHLFLLYLIHELVHVIMQFDSTFCSSLEVQEGISYCVGNRVLTDVLGEDAHEVIAQFTTRWPYDFVRIKRDYEGRVDLDEYTVVELLERGVFQGSE